MKKTLLVLGICLNSVFASAQNQPLPEIRSLVDLGVCHMAGNEQVARFLDGDRLKLQQNKMDLNAGDRNCGPYRDSTPGFKQYICGKDAFKIHKQEAWDMVVQVSVARRSVRILDTKGKSIFESVKCTPHNGHTIVY